MQYIIYYLLVQSRPPTLEGMKTVIDKNHIFQLFKIIIPTTRHKIVFTRILPKNIIVVNIIASSIAVR